MEEWKISRKVLFVNVKLKVLVESLHICDNPTSSAHTSPVSHGESRMSSSEFKFSGAWEGAVEDGATVLLRFLGGAY